MRVAVAPELDEVSRRLKAAGGMQVVTLTRPDQVEAADVVVVTGLSQDLLGDAERTFSGQVVQAEGQTTDQIVRQVQTLTHLRQHGGERPGD
jgi:hypothetical protein